MKELINIPDKVTFPADIAALKAFRFDNGQPFPPSYIDFCEQYGYGRLCGLFLIYVPLGDYPDSWFVQHNNIKALFDDYLDPPLYAIEEVPGGEALLKS